MESTRQTAGRDATSAGGRTPGAGVDALRDRVRREIGDEPWERYFAKGVRFGIDQSRVDVSIASPFLRALIDDRFGDSIRRAARDAVPDAEVRVLVEDRARPPEARRSLETPPPSQPHRRRMRPTVRRYRLQEFVRGDSNRLACGAIESFVSAANPRAFSPLFVCGSSGLGKTHLLQSAADEYQREHPASKTRCITAEAFTNDYVEAVRAGSLERFRRAYRGLDLLCLDDVQFLARKEGTQNELIHTLDALSLEGARIVLASDEHPRSMADVAPALVSRFLAGAVVRIDPPDMNLRLELAAAFGQRRGLRIEDEALRLIAERSAYPLDAAGSVRELEGIVTQVAAVTSLLPEFLSETGVVGVVAVQRALGLAEGQNRTRRAVGRPLRIAAILDAVCRMLHVDQSEVLGASRHRRVVMARGVAVYLARELTTHSFPEIARALHRPSHSTIVTADKRTRRLIDERAPVRIGPEFDGLHVGELADRVRNEVLDRGRR